MTSKANESLEPTNSEPTTNKRPTSQDEVAKPKRWVQIRLFPIWLRIIIVAAILAGAGAFGLTVGYGYIGEGEPGDVLKWSTWQHMLDIISGVE